MTEAAQPEIPATESQTPTSRPRLEVGILVVGSLDRACEKVLHGVRQQLLEFLGQTFPDFDWRMPMARREEHGRGVGNEPVLLLQLGSEEREARHWDFGFLITSSDLISRYKPFALAIVSRALDLVVISTARVDPRASDPSISDDECVAPMIKRLCGLMLHTLGHLNGLTHVDEPGNVMLDIVTVDDLAAGQQFTDKQLRGMTTNLQQIADLRLEEREDVERILPLSFYLRGVWINRHEIVDAVRHAKPWEFPIRLTRLTTAGVSSLVILMLTAETWDLALNQSAGRVAGLFVSALIGTSLYVVVRQQLFVQRKHRRLSEQTVITNVSASAIVLAGMFTMALLLFAISLASSLSLYHLPMVRSWAASVQGEITIGHYFLLATFVASLGIVIGALGASFEEQYYFRHVVFVDEET